MDTYRMHNPIVCSDVVWLTNSIMHSEMWASWLVYCCVW
jgi:hypothetical protein